MATPAVGGQLSIFHLSLECISLICSGRLIQISTAGTLVCLRGMPGVGLSLLFCSPGRDKQQNTIVFICMVFQSNSLCKHSLALQSVDHKHQHSRQHLTKYRLNYSVTN